jgi:hypothetical protein
MIIWTDAVEFDVHLSNTEGTIVAKAPIQYSPLLDRAARSHSLNVKLGALGAARSVGTGILVTQDVHTSDRRC